MNKRSSLTVMLQVRINPNTFRYALTKDKRSKRQVFEFFTVANLSYRIS